MPVTKKKQTAKGKPAARTAAPRKDRPVPRPFAFHWGGGNIIEEASFRGEHTEPAVQLLAYEGHPGSYVVRFCYYSLDGRFQRSPMMIGQRRDVRGPAGGHPRHAEAARAAQEARILRF